MKVLLYIQYGKYIFFLPTLDGLASIIRQKSSMNFLHYVVFTVKMGLEYSLFGETSLTVSKVDLTVIGPSRKRCDMLPLLSPSILYHRILSLLILRFFF